MPLPQMHPHMLRHTFVTTMLDAGVDLRDVQIAARHADPRTTMRYDRARTHLDRHPNYVLAAFMAPGHLRPPPANKPTPRDPPPRTVRASQTHRTAPEPAAIRALWRTMGKGPAYSDDGNLDACTRVARIVMSFSWRRAAWSLVASAVVVSLAACGGRAIRAGDVTVLVSERPSYGMEARGGGRLEVVGGCLGASGSVIVWPHGTKVVDEEPLRIEVPGYGVFSLGDEVWVGGGYVLEHSSDEIDPGPYEVAGVTVPAECAEHDIFLAH
jgi:hypothetical protein